MELIINDVDEAHSLLSCGTVRNTFPPQHSFHMTRLSLFSYGTQSSKLNKYIDDGILLIKNFNSDEIQKIEHLFHKYYKTCSYTNIGVIYHAHASRGTLITNEKILIEIARQNSVTCKNLNWVLSKYEKNIIMKRR